jgi:hypothetical protein
MQKNDMEKNERHSWLCQGNQGVILLPTFSFGAKLELPPTVEFHSIEYRFRYFMRHDDVANGGLVPSGKLIKEGEML